MIYCTHYSWLAGAVAALMLTTSLRAGDKLEYNRDIRPIFAENCFICHGQDSAARKAGLRLDQREEAIKKVIVPGKVEESKLVDRIFAEKDSKRMPPPKSNKTLTAAQRETLKRWIAEGAEYQALWSFIPPKRPTLPKVKNSGWARNPIDNFILADLEKYGLAPAPEADRRTLARRVSLDLVGLPPSPADVDRFVNDPSPDAYEKYVDHLLDSPHWGEHRGRYWLDAARYADTHGIHFDNYREIWAYRDWVINAFNQNMRFDRFTIEQLAGDLLPEPTLEQRIATGFSRCNITTNEGGAIDEEYLVLYTRDRTETAARVWLGLTANCAVCHDHKFDPLTQREFYEMAAIFNNTTQRAMDGNIRDTPPVIAVPMREDRPRWDALAKEVPDARAKADARKQAARPDFEKWLAAAERDRSATQVPSDGLTLHAPLDEGTGNDLYVTMNGQPLVLTGKAGFAWDAGHVAAKAFKSRPGGLVALAQAGDLEKDKGFSYGAWIKLPRNGFNGAAFARMDDQHDFRGWDLWIQNDRVGAHIINKFPQDALKVVTKNPINLGQWNHVFITYDGSGKAAGTKVFVNGVAQETNVEVDSLKSTIRTTVPLTIAQRHTTARLDDLLLQDMRLYDRTLSGEEVAKLAANSRTAWLLAKPASQRTDGEKNELFEGWLKTEDPVFQDLVRKVNDLRDEESAIKARGTVAHVMQERKEEPEAYVLYRGDYDKRRDKVKPSTPKFLPAEPAELPRNRLGFAKWLLREENPLTARVTVNRFWQEIFGTGIVRTSGDFGTTGESPSNQELLDWMAVEFRESGWDVKRFFKLIVTSSAYRQSSATTQEKLDKDPQNRLLSRGPRFRMDAEMIRDYALSASGLLNQKIGGPSVRPYQPPGVWEAVAMIGSDTRDYKRDEGNKLYRRSMYTFWKRAAPPASMEILNAPTREVCTVRRERTDTPLQALVTLNDPQFIEAARHLAQMTLKEGGDKTLTRLDFMAQRLLARPLRPEEAQIVEGILNDLLDHYKAHPDEAKKLIAVGESKAAETMDEPTLAAWTMTANQLMNLDEVLNK
jgi:mono/diheme cytochrome c family protein